MTDRGWAIRIPDWMPVIDGEELAGTIEANSVRRTRSECIRDHSKRLNPGNPMLAWGGLYQNGWRCVKVGE